MRTTGLQHHSQAKGFSLIELLIVVAIILVIAVIAIPNLLRARISANEASAITSVRAINTAQVQYATIYPTEGYADDLAKLGSATDGTESAAHSGLLDWVLGCATQPCKKSGYQFVISTTSGSTRPHWSYSVEGTPIHVGSTGIRGFCSYQMNPIKFDPDGGTNCTMDLQ